MALFPVGPIFLDIGDSVADRPAAPANATLFYNKTTGVLQLFDTTLATPAWVENNQTVFKTAAQTVNNSTVLVNDSQLLLPVVANAKYIVDFFLVFQSSTAADLQVAFTGPAGATFTWTLFGQGSGAASGIGTILTSTSVIGDGGELNAGGIGVAAPLACRVVGTLTTVGTAGTFQFRWAQAGADATNSQVLPDSYLSLRRAG